MNQNSEQLQDTAAAYVLGALPEIEIQAFRREMMRDCELGRYVEGLEAVGDMMLAASAPVEVPDALGAAIIAEARRDQEVAEIIASPRATAAADKKSGFRKWVLRPALGLVTAALLVVGGYAIGNNGGNETPAPTVASAEFAPAADKNVSGKVVPIGDGSDGAVVHVSNLNHQIGTDVYELWVARGDKVTRSSLFTVDENGDGSSIVPEDITDADAVMITREPAGGSPQPTSDVLAAANFS
ncbi:MAG: anti-sigma factor domain-containing protein [Solirubrobacterales bacterium]